MVILRILFYVALASNTILLPFRDLQTSPVWLLSVYRFGRHCLIVSDSYLWSVWLSGVSGEFVWLLSGSLQDVVL